MEDSEQSGKLHGDFPPSSPTSFDHTVHKDPGNLRCAPWCPWGGQKALQYKFNSSAQVFSTDVFFTVDVDLGSNLLMPASTDARARAKKNLEGFQLFGRDRCLAQMCKRIRFEVPNIDSTPSPLSGSPVFTWENQVHALRASSSVCRSCSGSKTP